MTLQIRKIDFSKVFKISPAGLVHIWFAPYRGGRGGVSLRAFCASRWRFSTLAFSKNKSGISRLEFLFSLLFQVSTPNVKVRKIPSAEVSECDVVAFCKNV